MTPRAPHTLRTRLRFAVALTFACHAALVIAGRYHSSYDAYTHMVFADHYLRGWGALWDPRWYAGFTVVSYPPLVHQVMALIGLAVGVDAAFALLLLTVLVMLTLAVYAFARIFTSPDAASYAAIGAAVLPAIYLSAHVFGQLPTLAAATFALLTLAALARFLRSGERLAGALTVALCAVTAAAHHATLLLLPFAGLAVAAHLLLNREVSWRQLLPRAIVAAGLSIGASLLVIWPFWLWGLGQAMQTPIDHLSRRNFLADGYAVMFFFVPVYGPLVVLLPFVIRSLARRTLLAPAALFTLLFVLGLGGTTPLPRLLFGAGWAWLTYDRFALWAALVLLVFFGRAAMRVRARLAALVSRRPRMPQRLFGAGMAALIPCAFAAALYPLVQPTQPPALDLRPVAAFLNAGDHAQWRYLTFGMGDQFAALALMTRANTIDGSYHTARALPELRTSGIGQIDSALWSDKGVWGLDPILQQAGARGVRWGFVARAEYAPVLLHNGWVQRGPVGDEGVSLWENPAAILPAPEAPPDDPLQAFAWSVFPLAALAVCGVLGAGYLEVGVRGWQLSRARVARLLLGLYTLAIGLLPFGLCIWLFHDLGGVDNERVYFTYTHALFYLSDALVVIAVAAWGLRKLIERAPSAPAARHTPAVQWLTRALAGFCALSTLSIAWSVEPRNSLYLSAHLWLLFALFCSLKDHPVDARVIVAGTSAALLFEASIGLAQFALQTTAFLAPLGLKWPGEIVAAMRGASVVQLADGTRWLRAYGTLPHPNILGGLGLALLAGPAAWLLRGRRGRSAAMLVLVAGLALLFVTFSRAAWLGCAAAAGVLVLHRRQFAGRRLLVLAGISSAGVLLVAAPMSQLILTRFGGVNIPTEQESIADRAWMTQQALLMIDARPMAGAGIGGFPVELASSDPGTYMIEPVHDLPLLAASELGVPGALLLLGMAAALAAGAWRARNPAAVIALAVLAGLAVVAVFDHYLWTLAPGRVLLWSVLGLWAGWS